MSRKVVYLLVAIFVAALAGVGVWMYLQDFPPYWLFGLAVAALAAIIIPAYALHPTPTQEFMDELAQDLGLKRDKFIFDSVLPSEDAALFESDYFDDCIGGIYQGKFVRIGTYNVKKYGDVYEPYTYIVVSPERFAYEHKKIIEEGGVQRFSRIKGKKLSFNKEQVELIRKNKIPHYYQFRFGVFERQVFIALQGKILDKTKLKQYLYSALNLMKMFRRSE